MKLLMIILSIVGLSIVSCQRERKPALTNEVPGAAEAEGEGGTKDVPCSSGQTVSVRKNATSDEIFAACLQASGGGSQLKCDDGTPVDSLSECTPADEENLCEDRINHYINDPSECPVAEDTTCEEGDTECEEGQMEGPTYCPGTMVEVENLDDCPEDNPTGSTGGSTLTGNCNISGAVAAPAAYQFTCETDACNVRDEPQASGSHLGTIYKNNSVTITACYDNGPGAQYRFWICSNTGWTWTNVLGGTSGNPSVASCADYWSHKASQ